MGARCGSAARRALCGGRRVTGAPTATPHRHPRQDLVGQAGGGVRHPPPHTTGAERASLARERDHTLRAAVLAPHAQEAMGEDAALQVGAQLLLDVDRQLPVRGTSALDEGLEVLLLGGAG